MALGNPYGGMMRCIMNADKTIAYFLDPNDSNYKMDGTAVDWALVESGAQNVMVQIPKFYYCKKWDEANQCFYFAVSSTIKDTAQISAGEWVIHPAFFKDQTTAVDSTVGIAVEVPYRYIGAFSWWVDTSGRMRSLPNKTKPAVSNIAVHRASTKAMGLGYCPMDYYLLYAIQMLYITEFGDPDSQKNIGYGYMTLPNTSGTTLINGNNTKPPTTLYTEHISYRGIEDLWGTGGVLIEGCNVYSTAFRATNVRYTVNTYYTNIATLAVSSAGYIRTIGASADSGFLPLTATTVAKTGLCDLALKYASNTYVQVSLNGGTTESQNYGIFGLNTVSTATPTGGSRLAL